MAIAPFAYDLPDHKIATHPPAQRGASRLLVVDRSSKQLHDKHYSDLPELLEAGDLVIINQTRVIKARIIAQTVAGTKRELFLAEKHAITNSNNVARVIYRGKLHVGDKLSVGPESIEVLEILGGGQALIKASVSAWALAESHGTVPLPPYIKRPVELADEERYQTVFAQQDGSVAAPTASLNLTTQTMQDMRKSGVIIAPLTLHVGRGTFLPIRTTSLEQHSMHSEYYEIGQETVDQIRRALQESRRIIAIGTTVSRALEHAASQILSSSTQSISAEADIFIYPGYDFRIISGLLTNFHAPDSTVLQLAAAFTGVDLLEACYRHALRSDYRFLSYGDSMFIY